MVVGDLPEWVSRLSSFGMGRDGVRGLEAGIRGFGAGLRGFGAGLRGFGVGVRGFEAAALQTLVKYKAWTRG